jgi:Na+/H+ antiporter NhaD/arsenite permease-like protein
MGPTVAVAFCVSLVLFKLFFRKDLNATVSNLEQIVAQDASIFFKDKKLLKKSFIVLLCVIFMFGFHGAFTLRFQQLRWEALLSYLQ